MSGPVDLGQTYRYRFTVKDSAGVAANAGTVVVTVTLPDGTTASPSVVNTSTGVYDISYTTTQSGLHNLFGSVTGGVLSSEFDKWEDAFTVETPSRVFVGLDEATAHLRAVGIITTDADREQLRWLCEVACDAVEKDLGLLIARRTIISTFDGGGYGLALQAPPRAADGGSITITTVVENGSTLGVGDYLLRKPGWRLARGASPLLQQWAYGYENITVTYVAGCADPPRCVRFAALGEIQLAWQSSQQASHPLMDDFSPEPAIAAGAPPHLASAMLRAYNSLKPLNFA